MNAKELSDRLESLAGSEDFLRGVRQLMKDLGPAPDSQETVEAILRFMERHGDIELGTPGPLVHFIERFAGQGYEQKLIESVKRRPVAHTVWMLNRLINGTPHAAQRQRLVRILMDVGHAPQVDDRIRHMAGEFLNYQLNAGQ
jgi:hypothetical protein